MWVKLNVYPIARKSIQARVTSLVESFHYIQARWNDEKMSKQPKFQKHSKHIHELLLRPGFDLVELAPTTNLVAETKYSLLDTMTKAHGGAMKMSTYCSCNLISTNKPFESSSFNTLSQKEKHEQL